MLVCPTMREFATAAETAAYRQGFVDGAWERERIQVVLDAGGGRMEWSFGEWLAELEFWERWGPASWRAAPWPMFRER